MLNKLYHPNSRSRRLTKEKRISIPVIQLRSSLSRSQDALKYESGRILESVDPLFHCNDMFQQLDCLLDLPVCLVCYGGHVLRH
jgi:hypothetical protein